MTGRWDHVKEVVASALEHSPDERESFIRQACGGDESLRQEVESLVCHHRDLDALLEYPPTGDILGLKPSGMIGRQIGAYRILEEMAEGGMAIVYLAERADQEFRRRVAIKMVKPGANNEEILARFRNERQTLAALDHPNIVKLLDGGCTEEGLPYLVMDYVEGVPLADYCDNHRLSIRDRLELFQAVCGAVQYAHHNGVIHRDLKPGNILVTKDGVARLLDFGIAKLLNPECLQTELVTRTGWRAMTPEYASPEQIRGEIITALTDVYSLGVVLYELLTGHRPYQTARHSWPEIERLVCDSEPESASAVIARTEETVSSDGKVVSVTPVKVSEARATTAEELHRCLRGDLDIIVMKALSKDRGQRYASVEAFIRDIDSYLSGLPIKARRPTFSYRCGKFLRRHRESVIAGVIVFAVMAALAVWEAERRSVATGEPPASNVHMRARPSVAILGFKNLSARPDTAWLSTAFSEMLTTELAAGEKLRTVPGETVARTKIDLSLPEAESLGSDTLARIRKNLGSDFVVLGSYFDMGQAGGGRVRLDLRLQDTAKGQTIATASETGTEAQLLELISRTGLRLREQLGVGELSAAQSAEVKAATASTPDAMRLYSQGLAKLRAFDALAARELLTSAVAADPSFPLAHSALAKAWLTLGYDSNAQQEAKKAMDAATTLSREDRLLVEARYYEASKQWDKAIETYRTLFSSFPDNLEFGLYLANAQVVGQRGKEAFVSIKQLRNLPGNEKDDPRIDLAEVEAAASQSDNKGTVEAAERAATKAASTDAKLLIARARVYECRALANLGRTNESKSTGEEARRIYQEAGDLAGVARALHAIAEVPIDQGDLDQAKKLYEEALAITRQIGDKRGEGRELGNIALIVEQQGDFSTAEAIYRESVANSRETGNKYGMSVDTGNMGDLRRAEGRLTDALAAYKEALALAREVGHKSSQAIDIQDIGTVLADQGDLRGAMEMYQQALLMQRDIGERRYYAATLNNVGRALRQQGDASGARKSLEEALTIYQQLGEKGNAAETELILGDLACDSGQAHEIEAPTRAAIQEFHSEKIRDDEIMGEVLLSKATLAQGRLEEAQEAMNRAIQLSEKSRDVTVRIPRQIQSSYVHAAVNDFSGAERAARQALAEARRLGFVQFQFEASLALGEIQIKSGNRATGRARLEQLEKDARSKGFELIAQKAAVAKT